MQIRGEEGRGILSTLWARPSGGRSFKLHRAGPNPTPSFSSESNVAIPAKRAVFPDLPRPAAHAGGDPHAFRPWCAFTPARLKSPRWATPLKVLLLLHHIAGTGTASDCSWRTPCAACAGSGAPWGDWRPRRLCAREAAHLAVRPISRRTRPTGTRSSRLRRRCCMPRLGARGHGRHAFTPAMIAGLEVLASQVGASP